MCVALHDAHSRGVVHRDLVGLPTSEVDPSIDPRLDSITSQATAIGKDDRFQTAAALRGALLAL